VQTLIIDHAAVLLTVDYYSGLKCNRRAKGHQKKRKSRVFKNLQVQEEIFAACQRVKILQFRKKSSSGKSCTAARNKLLAAIRASFIFCFVGGGIRAGSMPGLNNNVLLFCRKSKANKLIIAPPPWSLPAIPGASWPSRPSAL
jgi:hypothetical protein